MSCNTNSNFCNSPCAVTQTNNAACESLPSQVENFTTQFFGTVVKTEVDGKVVWTLPCDLETGLPNNPRAVGEGLACYFKRLFEDGIVGLTGPTGERGTDGTAGNNAYTVTLQGFVQPSSGAPALQVLTAYNPAMVAGLNIFIQGSGQYHLDVADSTGTLFLTQISPLPDVPPGTFIPAGKLVIPSGNQGNPGLNGSNGEKGDKGETGSIGPAGPAGPAGPTGATGATGADGTSFPTTNEFYYDAAGTDDALAPGVYAQVDFTSSLAQVTLPDVGKYLIIGTFNVAINSFAGGGPIQVTTNLRNVTQTTDIPETFNTVDILSGTVGKSITCQSIYTTVATNRVIGMFAVSAAPAGSSVKVKVEGTTLSAVRIA